jgi:hypothetical protein
MPQHVIATVERMGLEEGQPLMVGGTPIFEWAPGEAIVNDVYLCFGLCYGKVCRTNVNQKVLVGLC